MMKRKYRRKPWVSPKVQIQSSPIHGMGTFGVSEIEPAEVVAIWGGEYVNMEEAAKAKRAGKVVQQIDDDVFDV